MSICNPVDDDSWPQQSDGTDVACQVRLNIYRVMAHHPELLAAWGPLRHHVVVASALSEEHLEVVILRVGVRMQSDYEWAHHVVRARKCGLTDGRIRSIRNDPEGMAVPDDLIARAVDDLLDHKRIDSALQEQLMAVLGKQGLFDLIATVGFYSTLGYLANSFDVPIDEDIRSALEKEPIT